MDELDCNLLEAWNRVMARCQADPLEAQRRFARLSQPMMTTTPRAWCLTLRAGDTRMERGLAEFEPYEAPQRHEPHTVILRGDAIRELAGPVRIPWPGVPLGEAAKLMGKTMGTLRDWMPVRSGRTREQRAAKGMRRWIEFRATADRPLNVRYEAPGPHGHFGYEVPVVWASGALDPGAMMGAPPHPLWGTLWQTMGQRIRDQYAISVLRVPRWQTKCGRKVFAGWRWMCPGRRFSPDPGVPPEPCNRLCRLLYGPMPVYTISQLMGTGEGLELPPGIGPGDGRWHPGWSDPLAGMRSFACGYCWKVSALLLTRSDGWNSFVSYISGGLLYGSEVVRPSWLNKDRRRAYSPRPRRRAARMNGPASAA